LRAADNLFCFRVCREKHLFEPDGDVAFGFRADPDHFSNLARRTCGWFFNPDVYTRPETIDGQLRVSRTAVFIDISDNEDDVQVFTRQHLQVIRVMALCTEDFGTGRRPHRIEVTNGDQVYRSILKGRINVSMGMSAAADKTCT